MIGDRVPRSRSASRLGRGTLFGLSWHSGQGLSWPKRQGLSWPKSQGLRRDA
jgi:hypothetical protein